MSLLHPKNSYPNFVKKYKTIKFETPQSKSLNGLNIWETIQLFPNLKDHMRLWNKVYNLYTINKISSSQWCAFDNLCEYYHRVILTPIPIHKTTPYRMPFGKFKDFPLRVLRERESSYWNWLVYEADKTNWSETMKREVGSLGSDD